jgi:competence protein ComEA
VPDHGPEVDARAEAALEALREGRPVPGRPSPEGRQALTDVVARLVGSARPRSVALGAAGLVGAALVAGLAWIALRPVGAPGSSDDALFAAPATTVAAAPGPSVAATTTVPGIVVHAAGAVRQPGIYLLPAGSRVADLLDRAGGPTAETDLDRLNLAAPLADGQRLYVPRRGEQAPSVVGPDGGTGGSGAGAVAGATPAGPIDLNSATAEQLDTLPGIGPATAAAIVEHRERTGPFASVDALLDVRGIGPAKLDAIRELVSVG